MINTMGFYTTSHGHFRQRCSDILYGISLITPECSVTTIKIMVVLMLVLSIQFICIFMEEIRSQNIEMQSKFEHKTFNANDENALTTFFLLKRRSILSYYLFKHKQVESTLVYGSIIGVN